MMELIKVFTLFGADCGAKPTFLGLVPWYQYLPVTDDGSGGCKVAFDALGDGGGNGFVLISLAVAQDLLRLAALIAVGYVIYGGIQYATSQGSPDGTKKAQQTVINAIIGLVIAIIATTIVAFIGNRIGV